MRVAVIPARGGSKRIPKKNLRPFCGKPIIAWSIEAARTTGCFDRIIVSTDAREVAEVATRCGAEVPFLRPDELSDDHTGTVPVVAHALRWLRDMQSIDVSHVCCIYATAPFLDPDDLREGCERLCASAADYAIAVTRYSYPIQRALRIGDDGHVHMFHPELAGTRSQDLEPAFHDAGQFYWGTATTWLAGKTILSARSVPVVIPGYRAHDIDTEDDWSRAELMFRALRDRIEKPEERK